MHSINNEHNKGQSIKTKYNEITLYNFIEEDEYKISVIERVYSIIKSRSGRLTTKNIQNETHINIVDVRYAIRKLTMAGKIERIKGLGHNKIDFYYRIIVSK